MLRHPVAIIALPAATTRHLIFTGKGGVGKTSLACATAISLAEAGKIVLLVSTDPASNLDEVLRRHCRASPRRYGRFLAFLRETSTRK
ncbi:hypothetical protein SBBP1_160020 [Burkholderiales bacterium]|nr:hypothetical protein SBBP1_160020 [Burkholderiales bacterium]